MKLCKNCRYFVSKEVYSEHIGRWFTLERCGRPAVVDLVHGGRRPLNARLRQERYGLASPVEGGGALPPGDRCGRSGKYFKSKKP